MKSLVERSQVIDYEYWGDLVETIYEEEPWNEWISKMCSREYACGTDSDGNTEYCTEWYDCSYQDDHCANWWLVSRLGKRYRISETLYLQLLQKFGEDRIQVKQVRNYAPRDPVCSWGDRFKGQRAGEYSYTYKTTWDGSFEKHHFLASKHTYINKVQASRSVFNYPEVLDEDRAYYELFEYPSVTADHDLPTILGADKLPLEQVITAEKKFKWLNGNLGPRGDHRQIRVWILIFTDKTKRAGEAQEAYWKRGNKNELIVSIGIDESAKVEWVHPFTWSEVHSIPNNLRDFVLDMDTLNLPQLANYTYNLVERDWHRKEFAEFSYLTVEPPMWSIILAFVLQMLTQLGWGVYAVKNEIDNE